MANSTKVYNSIRLKSFFYRGITFIHSDNVVNFFTTGLEIPIYVWHKANISDQSPTDWNHVTRNRYKYTLKE